jgi:hypothetical protein
MTVSKRMPPQRVKMRLAIMACACILPFLAACQEETHSAQWYMGHGPELQAKLEECKKYPSLKDDQNCKNAGEAFATIVAATAQKQP